MTIFIYLCLILIYCKVLVLSHDNNINSVVQYKQRNEQMTIVSTVDGYIHGINHNNQKVWSSDTGGPMASAINFDQSPHVDVLSSGEASGDVSQSTALETKTSKEYSVLPAIDGSIMHHTREGMQKTSVTARFLAEKAPFVSKEGMVFAGSKNSKIMGLDITSGRILYDFSSGEFDNKFKFARRDLPVDDFNPTSKKVRKSSLPFWISRVDYSLRAYDGNTGHEEFNLTYSELVPLTGHQLQQQQSIFPKHTEAAHQNKIHPQIHVATEENPNLDINTDLEESVVLWGSHPYKETLSKPPKGQQLEKPVSLVSTPDGDVYFADEFGKIVDRIPINLNSPAMQAFNVKQQHVEATIDDYDDNSVLLANNVKTMKIQHRMTAPHVLSSVDKGQNNSQELDKDMYDDHEKLVIVQSSGTTDTDGLLNRLTNPPLYALEVEVVPASDSLWSLPGTSSINDNGEEFDLDSDIPASDIPRATSIMLDKEEISSKLPNTEVATFTDNASIDFPQSRNVESLSSGRFSRGKKTVQHSKAMNSLSVLKNMNHGKQSQSPRLIDLKDIHASTTSSHLSHINLKHYVPSKLLLKHRYRLCELRYRCENPGSKNCSYCSNIPSDNFYFHGESCNCNMEFRTNVADLTNFELLDDTDRYKPVENVQDVDNVLIDDVLDSLAAIAAESEPAHDKSATAEMTVGSLVRLRGHHVLRGDVYEGNLFSPHLFTGVLSGGPSTDGRKYAVIDDTSSMKNIISIKPEASYAARIISFVESLVLFGVASCILIVLAIMLVVFGMRCSEKYSKLLPPSRSYPTQVINVLQYLFDRVIHRLLHFLSLSIDKDNTVNENSEQLGISKNYSSPMLVRYDESGQKQIQVGALIYNTEEILGYGSQGTVVFKGSLNGRPVAVKRILSQFTRAAEREISLLIRSDGHPNVVRYYLKEQKSDFLYLGLQLCEMSLKDFVVKVKGTQFDDHNSAADAEKSEESRTKNSTNRVTDALRNSLIQIAQGVAHLHSQRIVHRDIKPHNILCANPQENHEAESIDRNITMTTSNENTTVENGQSSSTITSLDQLGAYVLKISDMGLSKQLDKEGSFSTMSFSMMSLAPPGSNKKSPQCSAKEDSAITSEDQWRSLQMMQAPVGTVGWQAPELIKPRYTGIVDNKDSISVTDRDVKGESPSLLSDDESIDEICENKVSTNGKHMSSFPADSSKKVTQLADENTATDPSRKSEKDKPEMSAEKKLKKRTLMVDIFSMGCVFHYVLTLGEHPFGEWFEREANIISGKYDLSHLTQDPSAEDLISWMLKSDPMQRPTALEVCNHPFFWACNRRLEFLVEFSDRLEQEPADSTLVLAVESNARNVIGQCWDRSLDAVLLEDIGKYRKYDASSVRDLLRLIRNKRHHFHELSDVVKKSIGALPVGFYTYFDDRFPRLLLHCVAVASRFLATERLFASWINKKSANRWQVWQHGTKAPTDAHDDTSTSAINISGGSSLRIKSSNGTNDADNSKTESSATNAVASTDASNSDEKVKSSRIVNEITASNQAATSSNVHRADNVGDVIVWQGSSLESSLGCRGWWRSDTAWTGNSIAAAGVSGLVGGGSISKKSRPSHLTKSAVDMKYRTRLCSHWEMTNGSACPMRKKGKCIFAHGPLELRVKESRRGKWGKLLPQNSESPGDNDSQLLRMSGGEDVLGAARCAGGEYDEKNTNFNANRSSKYRNTQQQPDSNCQSLHYMSGQHYPIYTPSMVVMPVGNNGQSQQHGVYYHPAMGGYIAAPNAMPFVGSGSSVPTTAFTTSTQQSPAVSLGTSAASTSDKIDQSIE